MDACRSIGAKGLSTQSHALCPKIREVDACVTEPLPSKKTWNGIALRLRLLEGAGIAVGVPLREVGKASADDVLDAAVAAWSAKRIAGGEAKSLPENAERDERGRQMAIWY